MCTPRVMMVTSEIPRGPQHMLDAETSVCRSSQDVSSTQVLVDEGESQSTDCDHPLAN
ncbi:uncharacterized protein BO88DRAFT_157690 [Aspergillus vadensis CBS 113365]|uniref:Uncharacterized protein n=1 Tax=Aspergillus vadensis (strain CBS 113365 / IMI 142717 / IBT 24658) TaxID=1448311 RepID=A0A319AXW8_ASPVC|nr:hypothetical protein BO88DRAFT_157690 [Aspergillus vadensis CBS 113365]PYH64615.1 hypothetical protein BO88DRAFT_157690 [Aspergillus vadensis CBS 113365]